MSGVCIEFVMICIRVGNLVDSHLDLNLMEETIRCALKRVERTRGDEAYVYYVYLSIRKGAGRDGIAKDLF